MYKILAKEFANILKEKDSEKIQLNTKWYPGIGSIEENNQRDFLVNGISSKLKKQFKISTEFSYPNNTEECDLKLETKNSDYYIELKLCRPFWNNGVFDEMFYKKIFSPYDKNTLMTDVEKLKLSNFKGQKAIMFVYYGKDHNEDKKLTLSIITNKIIHDADYWYNIKLLKVAESKFKNLIHPHHQNGAVVILEIQP